MTINNREISILPFKEFNWNYDIPTEKWLCILVDNNSPKRYLEEVHSKIIDHNVCYVCTVGEQRQLNHDLIDEEIIIRKTGNGHLPPYHIMTTWHNELEEGIWFALNAAFNEDMNINKVVIIDMTYGKENKRINRCLEKIKSNKQ